MTTELEGFDELEKLFEQAPQAAIPYIERAMDLSLALLHDALAPYPPESDANRPGREDADGDPLGYYERGRGYWYPVKRAGALPGRLGRRRGAMAAEIPGLAGYKLAAGGLSERLGTKWTTMVERQEGAVEGTLGTTVSYMDFVQGEQQMDLHARRGWVTWMKALEDSEEAIYEQFEEQAVKFLEDHFGGE